MAKAQTQAATNLAKGSAQDVTNDTGNFIHNTQGLQDTAVGNQAKTLGTSQQQGQAAQDQFGKAQDQFGAAKGTIDSTNPTYTDFMKTGGFSPSDETTYLNRATQGVSGTYDVLAKAAERQRAAAGGLGTGGEFSQMARQGTQQQALATENAQADLKQQENANKLAGAAGQVQAGQAETGVGQGMSGVGSGLSGLYGQTNQLYNTQTGEVTQQGYQILQAMGLKYNTQEEAANILAKLSGAKSSFGYTLGDIQSGAGAVGGALTGIAGAFGG